MKQNHTDITIVLDRSGSMQAIRTDTIGGFNKFLEEQKKAPGTAVFTLNQFDDRFDNVANVVNIQDAKPLTDETFVPRGYTALLDAIGRTITETGARLLALPESERPAKVVIVIITDGEENRSKEYTRAKINEMITHQREKYNWEFVFLGANQDAIKVGDSYGILRGQSMSYAANNLGATAAFASVGTNLTSFRKGTTQSMAFNDADRAIQVAAGANQ